MRVLFCAAALCLAPVAASAGSYAELAPHVSVSAFSDIDDDWGRRITQRKSECGYYGNQREVRRVDLLVERYNALADAVQASDEAAAMSAAKKLSRTIDQNERFKACWRHVARKAGVSSRLTRAMRDI